VTKYFYFVTPQPYDGLRVLYGLYDLHFSYDLHVYSLSSARAFVQVASYLTGNLGVGSFINVIKYTYLTSLCKILISCYCCCCESDRFNHATQEVCQLETMEGRCRWNSEVIVIVSTLGTHGNRSMSGHSSQLSVTVWKKNPLFLGCSENVLPLLDAKCSGRSECDVEIPDPDLDKLNPDHERYLEARVVIFGQSCSTFSQNIVTELTRDENQYKAQ